MKTMPIESTKDSPGRSSLSVTAANWLERTKQISRKSLARLLSKVDFSACSLFVLINFDFLNGCCGSVGVILPQTRVWRLSATSGRSRAQESAPNLVGRLNPSDVEEKEDRAKVAAKTQENLKDRQRLRNPRGVHSKPREIVCSALFLGQHK